MPPPFSKPLCSRHQHRSSGAAGSGVKPQQRSASCPVKGAYSHLSFDLFHRVVLHKLGGLLIIISFSTLLPRPWRDSRAGKEKRGKDKGGKAEADKEEAARCGAASGVARPAVSACKAAAVLPLHFLSHPGARGTESGSSYSRGPRSGAESHPALCTSRCSLMSGALQPAPLQPARGKRERATKGRAPFKHPSPSRGAARGRELRWRHFRSSPGTAGQRAEQDVSLGVPLEPPAASRCFLPPSLLRPAARARRLPASLGEARRKPCGAAFLERPLCPAGGMPRCAVGLGRGGVAAMLGGEEDLREGGRKWRRGTARLRFPRAGIRPCPQPTPDPFFSFLPFFLFVRLSLPHAGAEPRPLAPPSPQDPGRAPGPAGPSPLFPGGQRELWKGGEEDGGLDPPTAVPGLSFSSPSPRLCVARLTPPSLPRRFAVSSRCLPASFQQIVPLPLSPFCSFLPRLPPCRHSRIPRQA